MDNKQKLKDFLTTNWEKIENQRQEKNFTWTLVAEEFHKLTNIYLSSEYIRGVHRNLRDKVPSKLYNVKLPIVGEFYESTGIMPKEAFKYTSGKEDKATGKKEFTFTADTVPTESQIVEHFNIDLTKYRINQIYHKTSFGGKYSITVSLLAVKGNKTIDLDDKFIEKLNGITQPVIQPYEGQHKSTKPKACLLIPKQDVHWNKHDINGKNNIAERFSTFTKTILTQLEKAQAINNIEKIVYIVGSDEFNSEWTGTTTKGTVQQNILSYQETFEKVTEFTIEFVKLLRFYSPNIEIVLLNGNHDHNVSWHLANLLKHVFSKNSTITVNTDLVNTKVLEYASNLILINHGDEMKPKDLATKFPIIAKDKWSSFDNYFVISGDKHHEVAHDYNGVRTFQLPQLSTAKSNWDDKKGHVCSKAELITFVFEKDGLANIFRNEIK